MSCGGGWPSVLRIVELEVLWLDLANLRGWLSSQTFLLTENHVHLIYESARFSPSKLGHRRFRRDEDRDRAQLKLALALILDSSTFVSA
jgi:hypothetical protein